MFVYNQISFADVEEKLNHILQEIKNIELKEEYKVTASIGVCFVDHEKTSKELFTKCDQVLYECKNSGKNSFKIFNK